MRPGHAGGESRKVEPPRLRLEPRGFGSQRWQSWSHRNEGCRRRPTLPRPRGRSTIGAAGLNGRVRDGNGCGPCALVASDFDVQSCVSGTMCCSGNPPSPCRERGASVVRAAPARDRKARIEVDVPTEVGAWAVTGGDGMCCVLCGYDSSAPIVNGCGQASRAIRTAALGTPRGDSTGGLSTCWSRTALRGPVKGRGNSSWKRLPT